MTDFDIENKLIKLGYIPIIVNFEGRNEENVYIIKKEQLSFAMCLSR